MGRGAHFYPSPLVWVGTWDWCLQSKEPRDIPDPLPTYLSIPQGYVLFLKKCNVIQYDSYTEIYFISCPEDLAISHLGKIKSWRLLATISDQWDPFFFCEIQYLLQAALDALHC